MTDWPALHKLVAWRLEQSEGNDEDLDAREICDWLWLFAKLDSVALPRRYAWKRSREDEEDADPPSPIESADTPSADPQTNPQRKDFSLASPDRPAPEAAVPMARLVPEKLLPDGDAVAEELERRLRGVPLRLRHPPLLRDPLRILQALRPLLRKSPHPRRRVLDEERSAASSAEWKIAWPEYRPALEPRLAVRVVLDGGVSMAVWEPLAQELQRVLTSSQAFRRVDLQRLTPPYRLARPPAQGADADADTIVTLLLSDTAGHHWWDGTIQPSLEILAHHQPLVVLHTLPPRYWDTTALERAQPVTLRNREPLVANRHYQRLLPLKDPWDDLEAAEPEPLRKAICLPVISLDRRELATWAALVTGEAQARCAGRLLPAAAPNVGELPIPAGATSEKEAQDLWVAFTRQASPEARELLLSMAASPFLSLPVLRLLQAVEAPEAFAPQPLAEVLVSGLVRRLPGQEQRAARPERLQFELLPAVHRLLQPRLDPKRRGRVLAAVTALLKRHWNRQVGGSSFWALLLGPKDLLERDHPDLFHNANVTAAMLDQLPGQQFQELADQLRGHVEKVPEPPIPKPEPIRHSDDRVEEVELLYVEFPTLRPAHLPLFLNQVLVEGGRAARANLPIARRRGFYEPLQRDGLPAGATTEKPDPLALTLLEIPAGRFLMGSPPEEPNRFRDEGPQNEVKLAHFFLSQTPITQAQWRVVALWEPPAGKQWQRELKAEPSYFKGQPDSGQRPPQPAHHPQIHLAKRSPVGICLSSGNKDAICVWRKNQPGAGELRWRVRLQQWSQGRVSEADNARAELPRQCLGPARHARQYMGVVPRPLALGLRRCAHERQRLAKWQ